MPTTAYTGNFIQGFSSANTGIRGTNIFSMGENLGNFAVQTNMDARVVRDIEGSLNGFSQPITLATLNVTQPVAQTLLDNNTNITLNADKSNVRNYAYFGSLAEYIRVSIEDIITNFPASLYISNDNDVSILNTILSYYYNPDTEIAQFVIPASCVINNYNLLFTPKTYLFTDVGNIKDISSNFTQYSIWDFETEYPIVGFSGTTDPVNGYLIVQTQGNPFPLAEETGQYLANYHVKPNFNTYETYMNGLDDFEAYLLNRDTSPKYSAVFKDIVQTADGTPIFLDKTFTWTTTDGYNLDYDTFEYQAYLSDLLALGHDYDNYKTNLISRFLTTASIKEFDTIDHKADKLLKIYGREFDEIKKFIDQLANVNKVTYDKKDNIPDTLVKNLAKTLGWGTFSTVSESDLMASFLGQANNSIIFSGQSKNLTPVETDIELWRRLIINSAKLFKSKGTRKCINFLLKIIGAPDSLVSFNEYVYLVDNKIDVNNVFNSPDLNYPFDSEGYPVIPSAYTSDYYFQMKGGWRTTLPLAPNNDKDLASAIGIHTGDYDNGQMYFDPYVKFDDKIGFTLSKTVDNVKSWTYENTGATRTNLDNNTNYNIQDSRLVLNTKEMDIFLDPAQAIEYDVYSYNIAQQFPINLESLIYPYPNTDLTKADVSQMSFIQYVDFVYSNFINAKNRKVATDNFGGGYPTLQMIYRDYYYAGQNYLYSIFTQEFNEAFGSTGDGSTFMNIYDIEFLAEDDVAVSNQLDYNKVGKYIEQIDGFWLSLLEQFIPSTTIWSGGKLYRNTVFERQKYVYKHGINDGSEFTTTQPVSPNIEMRVVSIYGSANVSYTGNIANRIRVDNIYSTTLNFPEPGVVDSGGTIYHLRVNPWITGNTMRFAQPLFTMNQVAKISTGQTEPVRHNMSVSAKTVGVIFTGNTASMLTSNPQTKFRYRVYPYDYNISGFTSSSIYTKLTDQDFSGQTGTTLVLNDVIPNQFADGDYLVKASFLKTGNTTNQFGYNFTQPYTIDTEAFNAPSYYEYDLYDPNYDYWFTAVSNPYNPIINSDIYDSTYQPTNSGLTLVNKQLPIAVDGITALTFSDTYLGSPMVNVNGNILLQASNSGLTDGDYFITVPSVGTSNLITLANPLYVSKGDTITLVYLQSTAATNSEIASESEIINTIPSGSTDAAQGSQVQYNTSTNQFEYYTNFAIGQEVAFSDLVIMVNGNSLVANTDYIQTNNKYKIILLVPLEVGDTIIIFYPTQDLTKYLYLSSPTLNVDWTAVTDSAPGLFTAECTLATDVNFTNILFSGTTPYLTFATPTQNSYTVFCGNITTPNQTFILRVRSDKYFTDLLGEVITTTSYSEVLTFKTDNRVLG